MTYNSQVSNHLHASKSRGGTNHEAFLLCRPWPTTIEARTNCRATGSLTTTFCAEELLEPEEEP